MAHPGQQEEQWGHWGRWWVLSGSARRVVVFVTVGTSLPGHAVDPPASLFYSLHSLAIPPGVLSPMCVQAMITCSWLSGGAQPLSSPALPPSVRCSPS